ncbi:conserved protein, unknown function [Plasmodium gallinaceum]|uniref:Uncharacterized protein n=1 Tax=Plasmodium gallinaceum TaxID=5849 RepID=A0A1J1GWZ6_PLAGA|nr:conserved protein, unknown function [Plasmodium gallinaceum]CRG96784.1 conserved protein, unknown function [Plasmodium gallinaceum]
MVLIHVKSVEDSHQFLYETNVNVLIKNLKEDLVNIHNLRCKILKLLEASLDLANHGPMRPEELRGLSEDELKISKLNIYEWKEATNPDKYNFRTGIPPPSDGAIKLKNIVDKVKKELSIEKIEQNKPINTNNLYEHLNMITEALNICYPSMEKLPPYDPTRILIEKDNFFNDEFISNETSLWWAGKELSEELYLKNIIGKNEKTKIIVRVQPKKLGPPIREARIDSETYKAMLAYYHKKQKEEKEFEEDDDDSYLNSEWANPLSLQKQLHGNLNNIKWKP